MSGEPDPVVQRYYFYDYTVQGNHYIALWQIEIEVGRWISSIRSVQGLGEMGRFCSFDARLFQFHLFKTRVMIEILCKDEEPNKLQVKLCFTHKPLFSAGENC